MVRESNRTLISFTPGLIGRSKMIGGFLRGILLFPLGDSSNDLQLRVALFPKFERLFTR